VIGALIQIARRSEDEALKQRIRDVLLQVNPAPPPTSRPSGRAEVRAEFFRAAASRWWGKRFRLPP